MIDHKDRKEGMMNQMYLGHRIHFNWPLIIIMAWLSLMLWGALTSGSENTKCIPYPYYEFFSGE